MAAFQKLCRKGMTQCVGLTLLETSLSSAAFRTASGKKYAEVADRCISINQEDAAHKLERARKKVNGEPYEVKSRLWFEVTWHGDQDAKSRASFPDPVSRIRNQLRYATRKMQTLAIIKPDWIANPASRLRHRWLANHCRKKGNK